MKINKLLKIAIATTMALSLNVMAKTQNHPVSMDTPSEIMSVITRDSNETKALYGVGFETSEDPGYAVGFFDNAVAGWQQYTLDNPDTATNSIVAPEISTANPKTGAQHLRLDNDPAYATGTSMGTIFVLPEALNDTDKQVFSVDVNLTMLNGSDIHFQARSRHNSTTLRTWWVDIGYQGNIRMLIGDHDGDTFLDNVTTGTMWDPAEGYMNIRVETDPTVGANGELNLYKNDVLIYTTGLLDELGGVVADHIYIYSDNWQADGEFGDVDNVFFDSEFVAPAPDLALTKTNDTVGPVAMGATVNYTLTVENVGVAGDSANVVLTDTMPAGMSYVNSTCDDTSGSGTSTPPTVTFNLDDIASGDTTICTVVATVGDFGEHINNATVTSDGDVDSLNDSATSTVTGPNEVDMSIVKTSDAAGQLAENATLVYTLAVTNNDLDDSGTNVVVTDTLPAEVTYGSNDCGASEAAGTVTWNAGAVPANTTVNCNVTVTVTGFGTFANTATVAADDADNTPANNTSTTTVDGPIAVTGVDLVMSKTSDAAGVMALGDSVTYTLSVSNTSTNDATNTTVSDSLPAGLNYVSNTCGASVAGNNVTWNIGTLAGGANISCDIMTTIAANGNITNTASVSSTESDNNSTDNSSSAVVAGPPAVDLAMSKTVSAPDPLAIGDTIVYTLTVNSVNSGDATGVVVTDDLPAGVTYMSNSCGAGVAAGTLTWNIGNMVAGTSTSCNVTATIDVDGTTNNTATVSANEADVAGGNNSGSASVFIGVIRIIPTLNFASLLLMMLVLGFFGRKMLAKD